MSVRSSTIVSAALLAIYVCVGARTFWQQSTGWPGEGNWGQLVFFLLVPGLVFQIVNLVFTWRTRRRMGRRLLVRVVTIPVGLGLAALLALDASARAWTAFIRAYGPFVARVEANLASPCGPAAAYFALPSVAAYNRRAGNERPTVKLHYDRRRFVLAFAGTSFDMDGSTIYYGSEDGQWRKFHNDFHDAADAFDHLVDGLEKCVLRPE